MKKILIAIILIIVIIGGIVILSGRRDGLQDAANEARTKSIEAAFKVFVMNTMSDMGKYYSDLKNENPSYVKSEANMTKIDANFAELKAKYKSVNSSYKIFDEKENASIKVADSDRGVYVCIDSVTVKVTTISADQFDKKTDCDGKDLN